MGRWREWVMCSSGLLLCGGIHRDLFTVIYMCACVCVVCAFVEEGKILVYICFALLVYCLL